jgi:hypothetical protein
MLALKQFPVPKTYKPKPGHDSLQVIIALPIHFENDTPITFRCVDTYSGEKFQVSVEMLNKFWEEVCLS